jgi:hypothetical protein
MIARKTVLILGAGASAPFGFPSGRTLRDDIIAGLRKQIAQPFQLLTAAGFDANHIASFRDALQRSGQPSVDVFLEYRPEFIHVGKVAIAASLIPYEDEARLWGGADNWYEHLWTHLGPSLMDDVAQSQLSVITFNYDRSLEHFLFSALKDAYNISTDDAARYLREVIRIVHVHGKLGELPYADAGRGISRSYQPGDASSLKDTAVAAAKTIKIVHEGVRDDSEFVQARQLLAQAEMVCFLGFGYLKANVERLEVANLSQSVSLYGTAYLLMDGERAAASGLINNRVNLGRPDLGVLAFLRQTGLLI